MAGPNLPEPYPKPPHVPYPASPAGWPHPAPLPLPVPLPVPAPYGFDPVSGRPFSEKSKVIAGLLQLLPGFFLSLGGIGRLYAGHVTLGVMQLVGTAIGWVAFWCGLLIWIPLIVTIGMWAWFIVDGIVLMAGRSTDGEGRILRS